MTILTIERIQVEAQAADKTDAIRQAGELLVATGCVQAGYVDGMLLREQTMSTYIGNGVAIPHGTHDHIDQINSTAISVLQLPDGVVWEDDEKAYLVIGIAANSDEHITILSNLAEVVEDESMAEHLAKTASAAEILALLNRQPEPDS